MKGFPDFLEFNEKNVSKVNNVNGVYLLAVGLKNRNNLKVFYVGSGNTKERLQAHLMLSEPNNCVKNYVKGYECYFSLKEVKGGKQTELDEEEKIKDYFEAQGKAKCNIQ